MTDAYQLNLKEAISDMEDIASSCPSLRRDIYDFIQMIENCYEADLDEEGYFDD